MSMVWDERAVQQRIRNAEFWYIEAHAFPTFIHLTHPPAAKAQPLVHSDKGTEQRSSVDSATRLLISCYSMPAFLADFGREAYA